MATAKPAAAAINGISQRDDRGDRPSSRWVLCRKSLSRRSNRARTSSRSRFIGRFSNPHATCVIGVIRVIDDRFAPPAQVVLQSTLHQGARPLDFAQTLAPNRNQHQTDEQKPKTYDQGGGPFRNNLRQPFYQGESEDSNTPENYRASYTQENRATPQQATRSGKIAIQLDRFRPEEVQSCVPERASQARPARLS